MSTNTPANTTDPIDKQLPKKRKPASPRRIAANRANAQHSTGPKTDSGKQRSAMNALRHGLLAQMTVLDYESKANFEHVAQQYHTRFNPADDVEANYVDELASTYWRTLRLRFLETRLINHATLHEAAADPFDRLLNAFVSVGDAGTLALFSRYEAQLSRAHHRAFRMLRDLQKGRPPVTPQLPDSMVEPDRPYAPPQPQAAQPDEPVQSSSPEPALTAAVKPEITYTQTNPIENVVAQGTPLETPLKTTSKTPISAMLKHSPKKFA